MITDATKLPKPADVREALQDALSVCSSVHTSADRRRVMRGGGAMYLQTEEWCRWLEDEVAPKLRAALLSMPMINGTEEETAATASCAGTSREGSQERSDEEPDGAAGTPKTDCTPAEQAAREVSEPTPAMFEAFRRGFQQPPKQTFLGPSDRIGGSCVHCGLSRPMHQKDGACIMQSHTTSVEASAHPAAPDLGAMADALMAKMRPAPMEPAAPQPASAQVAVSRIVHLRADRERRIYIAGPMTGLPEYNFPAFNAAAERLRGDGWHVENPAEHGHVAGAEWSDYLRWDLSRVVTVAAVYLLPGWPQSKGATLEVTVARALGLAIICAPGAEDPSAQVAEPVAWVWPKGRDVTRLGDMSPPGDTRLRVLFDSDNDVCVEVLQQDLARGEFALAAVEFCNGGGGGGQSPKTRKALVALMAAIEEDNADAPHKAWPLPSAPGAAPSVQPAPDREGEKP
jgi:hypothetical protein